MSDNPFLEPGDEDGTVILSLPQQPAAAPLAGRADGPVSTGTAGFADIRQAGLSPLMAAAAPLLSLLARLRNILSVPDPDALRARTVDEIRRFEQSLRDQNQPVELIRASHYALCASLDDVVRNTPWGSQGAWADTSLVAAFHGEVRSGERFFDILDQLCRQQGKFLPVIELMYVCMSLGMQGRYRLSPRGPAELDRVREETYVLIMRQRQLAERELSPHWRGVSAPYRPLGAALPVWVAAVGALGLLGLIYGLLLFSLNDRSDRLFEAGLALPPGHMPAITRVAPPQPAPPQPAPERGKLAGFLAPEVASGRVSIAGTEAVPIVRIQSAGLFRSGPVSVIGYTDNQPIHTVAFPSNFQLSGARAKAAAGIIGAAIDPARLTVEGRADADPIASNDAPAGREQNRRIELVLRRSGNE